MLTPVEQFRRPRDTLSSALEYLASHKFAAAVATVYGDEGIHHHNLVLINLRIDPSMESSNDMLMALHGYDHANCIESWANPNVSLELEHEWTHGTHGDAENGMCYWRICDNNMGVSASGAHFHWDRFDTEFPMWFEPNMYPA